MGPTIDPEDAVAPIAIVEGAGVKVGEGTVIHPSIGMEAGVVSNVFYTDQNPTAAGIVRILGEVGAGSLPAQRLASVDADAPQAPETEANVGIWQYRADLRLTYDYYPSGNEAVSEQGGLGAGFLFRGILNPHRPWQGAVVENYQRLIRPTNFESAANVNRDVNILKAQVMYAPYGRSINATLRYQMMVDVFESDRQAFANRFQNTLGLRLNWQWLPYTRVFGDLSGGLFTGIGSSTKVTSYPLAAVAGIQTLLTPAITLVARAGYTNGFYSSGPSYSAALFGAQVGYRYSPTGRVAVLYNYTHNDSINANFYRDHDIRLTFEHGFNPFDFIAQGGVIFRQYEGLISTGPGPVVYTGMGERNDVLGLVNAEMLYNYRDWFAFSAEYQLQVDQTDYSYMTDGINFNPSYVRHELLAGVRAAY